jgi:anti-anti-sigma factor
MPEGMFELEGGRLIVRTNLDAGREEELRKHCDRLLAWSGAELVIDLSAVGYIHSLSVGTLSYTWVEALNRDKEVRFVVSQYVSDVFARTGLSRVFTCDPAGTDAKG